MAHWATADPIVPHLPITLQLRLGMPASTFTYVYILRSEANKDAHYTGCTTDLKARLTKHNEGGVPHTAKWRPWIIETAVRFRDPAKARAFEKYLIPGSWRCLLRDPLDAFNVADQVFV